MKATVTAELLLLLAVAAVAYLVYVQQQQIADFELELDRLRGAIGEGLTPPLPVSERPAAAPPSEGPVVGP